MSTTTDDDRIGPQLTLEDLRLPPHVGESLGSLLDRDRIETGAAWTDAMRAALERSEDRAPTAADLCTSDDGPHGVETAETDRAFVCVLDPLMVPFIEGTSATVRSVSPAGGEVTTEVTESAATASPSSAVVSLGVAHDPGDGAVTPERIYRRVCPYIHAFETPAAYERWDGSVDAATTSLPVETGVALARELADRLLETR